MPFPTAWDSLPNVGPARGNRSNTVACADPKIRGAVRRRQPSEWTADHAVLPEVRCRDIWRFLEEAHSSPALKSSNRSHSGQCALPSCDAAQAVFVSLSKKAVLIIPAAVQSRLESSRKSLEAGTSIVYSQQIFSDTPGSRSQCIAADGCLEKAESDIV